LICEAAERLRSEHLSAARAPKPFSAKFKPAWGIAADAAKFAPDEMRGVDSPLPHQIQGQPTEIVLRQRRGRRGALAPAFAHRPRHIVFAAS